MTRSPRHLLDAAELPIPKRPYRDSLVFHAVLAALLVLIAYLTASGLARAVVVASGYFVIATAWSWWSFRRRIAAEEQQR